MTWNGKINEQCCRTCKSSKGACHGSECEKRAASAACGAHTRGGAASLPTSAVPTFVVSIRRNGKGLLGLRFLRPQGAAGPYKVISLVPGGAACASGVVRAGDWFCAVNGQDVSALADAGVAALFEGAPGTNLTLTLYARPHKADTSTPHAKNTEIMANQTADFSLYHATSLEAALRIQAEGFRVPKGPVQQKAGALLGPGVYASATLQKAMKYCAGPEGGIVFELAVNLGRCKRLVQNDPMMTSWQQHGYDSAWAPTGTIDAGGNSRNGACLEENCIKDPKKIKIIQAIAGHTFKLQQEGYKIVGGKIVKVK